MQKSIQDYLRCFGKGGCNNKCPFYTEVDIPYAPVIHCKRREIDEIAANRIDELQDTVQAQTKALLECSRQLAKRWISVKEALPEHENHVLVVTQTAKGKQNIVRAYYCHHLQMWAAGMNSNVTHWMELPPLPEAVND